MNLGSVLLSSCVQLVWPARCVGCDQVLTTDAAVFCAECAPAVSPVTLACGGCATPGMGRRDGPGPGRGAVPRFRCPVCARLQFAFTRAFVTLEYGGPLASGIIRMKHGGRPDLARRLGRLMRDTLARAAGVDGTGGCDDPVDLVVPVPLHARKLRRRGFNQALDLTRVALAGVRRGRATGTAMPALERSLLVRVRDTRELGHFGPGARQVEVFGAFAVIEPWRVAGRRVLVVDDVMTTGATLNECAETLIRAGAREVRVAALARAA